MKNKSLQYALMGVPFVLGAYGLLMSGETVPNALYSALNMYFLNYGAAPVNLLIEAARWLAPLATASGILMAIAHVRIAIRNSLRYHRGDSIAIYGASEQRHKLIEELGKRAIDGGEGWDLVPAQTYLLVGSEEENLQFYCENRERLQGHDVYLRSRTIPSQSVEDVGLHIYCPEETAARVYWREQRLYEESRQQGHQLQIVMIGFGPLGDRLLSYALQTNIYDPAQRIEYHIFGDAAEFLAVHTELAQITDPVITHTEPWYQALPLLEEADRCIVLPQENQFGIVQELLLATHAPRIDVFTINAVQLELLEGHERLRPFQYEEVGESIENIFRTTMFDQAMALNLRYAHIYSGVEETADNRDTEWAQLNGFTRYSNVSAADYHVIRLQMMEALGWPVKADELTAEQLELLAHLEHIRWCRYHQRNNWRYGQPANGKRKDPIARIHADLVPYEQLTDAEREKDRDNIRLLLEWQTRT